jgi:hypothetical protein
MLTELKHPNWAVKKTKGDIHGRLEAPKFRIGLAGE